MPTVKACTKCGEVKPLDGFRKDKRGRDGRHPRCKECMSEYHRRYREENPEKIREYGRRYREENPEKERERHRRRYEENREKILECNRRYYEENLEKERERRRRHHYENREEILEYHRRYYEENRDVVKAKTSSHRATTQELTKALSIVQPHVRWSEEEDAILMADNGMTVYEKATQLGRTYGSCIDRRHAIRKLRRITNV